MTKTLFAKMISDRTPTWGGNALYMQKTDELPGHLVGFFVGSHITKNQTSNHLAQSLTGFSLVQEQNMLAPNPENPVGNTTKHSFENLLDTALKHSVSHRQSLRYFLQLGYCPAELCRYSAGSLSENERNSFQAALAQQPWAMQTVVKLVKGSRTESLAAQIIRAAKQNKDSKGILKAVAAEKVDWNDPELSLAELLDSLPN